MAKYIFVTGGVVSSLGKGIAASSIGVQRGMPDPQGSHDFFCGRRPRQGPAATAENRLAPPGLDGGAVAIDQTLNLKCITSPSRTT